MIRNIFLFSLVVALGACSTTSPTSGQGAVDAQGRPTGGTNYETDVLLQALRTVALRFTQSTPSLEEVNEVEAGGFSAYEAKVNEYLDSAAFQSAALDWCRDTVFRLREADDNNDEINYDDPGILCAFLITEDESFKDILLADYKVTANGVKIAQESVNDSRLWSGFMTMRAFLEGYSGALNFARVREVGRIASCFAYPDTEFEGWDLTEVHPKYHGDEGKPEEERVGENCFNCHKGLNKVRRLYTDFDDDGVYNEGRTLNNVEPDPFTDDQGETTRIGDVEENLVSFFSSRDKPLDDVREWAEDIASTERHERCITLRFLNYMLGNAPEFDLRSSSEDDQKLLEDWQGTFGGLGWRPKSLLREIALSDDFLSRMVRDEVPSEGEENTNE